MCNKLEVMVRDTGLFRGRSCWKQGRTRYVLYWNSGTTSDKMGAQFVESGSKIRKLKRPTSIASIGCLSAMPLLIVRLRVVEIRKNLAKLVLGRVERVSWQEDSSFVVGA